MKFWTHPCVSFFFPKTQNLWDSFDPSVKATLNSMLDTDKSIDRWLEYLDRWLDRCMNNQLRGGLCISLLSTGIATHHIFAEWEHYTGRSNFPVPYPSGKMDPGNAYTHHNLNGTLFEGEYGEMRKDLAKFFHKELTTALKQIRAL